MIDPTTKVHPAHNLELAGKYLDTLTEKNLSSRYFKREQVYKSNWLSYLRIIFNIPGYLRQLENFYPFHRRITESRSEYHHDLDLAIKEGLIISAVSMFTIFQMGRRGYVLPLLNQYGRYLKTHRIFRQYIWAAVLPTTILWTLVDFKHINNVEVLWRIHARRMQAGIIQDPDGTRYPTGLLPINLKDSWKTPYIYDGDIERKLRNQTDLVDAPDYVNPEFQTVDVSEAEGGEEGDEEEQDQ